MPETVNYSSILKREGLKSTKHRNSILEVLENSEQPITAECIFSRTEGKEKPNQFVLCV